MEAEVEYTALVRVKVDLETGGIALVDIRAPGRRDETPAEVSVSLESERDEPDEVFDRAQQLVDAAAPLELHGWWAPAPRNDGPKSTTRVCVDVRLLGARSRQESGARRQADLPASVSDVGRRRPSVGVFARPSTHRRRQL
jgi:hypothetical protein